MNAQEFDKRRRNARWNCLTRFIGGLLFCATLSYTMKKCYEVNGMESQDKSNIEEIISQAHCGHKGKLHYQVPVLEGDPGFSDGFRSYCLVGDNGCPFYVRDKKGDDYCNAYRRGY